MISIAVWLLIAVSEGTYNRGTTTTIAQLPTAEACSELKVGIESRSVEIEPTLYVSLQQWQ
jgi:hypothetical protein